MSKNIKPTAKKKMPLSAVVTIRMTAGERALFREKSRLVGKTDSEVARGLLVGAPCREDRICLTTETAWDYNRVMQVRGCMEKVWMCVRAVSETRDPGERERGMDSLSKTLLFEFQRADEELLSLQFGGLYGPLEMISTMNTEEANWNFNDH
jgi:hypothetical protein